MSGCAGNNSVSSYARTGDTVTIAFAGDDYQPFLRRESVVAQLTDSIGQTRLVKVRTIAHIYADPTSRVAADKGDPFSFDSIGLRVAVIDLVDPGSGTPPQLALGPASLKLTRAADGALVVDDIAIEILPGTGSLHPFTEQLTNLSYLEAASARPQARFRIKPVGVSKPELGAVEVELRFPNSALAGIPETRWPQAVPIAADANVQFTSRYYQDGTDRVIRVIIINPDGFIFSAPFGTDPAIFYRGKSLYHTLRFAVVWGESATQTSYTPDTFNPSVITNAATALKVFDVNGVDVTPYFTVFREP
jgi:hypothetical protein